MLPSVSAALYVAMTVSSAWRHDRGARAAWKGRAYGTTSIDDRMTPSYSPPP